MNPLLIKPVRRVALAVTLPAIDGQRPAAEVYVRALTAAESVEMGEKLRNSSSNMQTVAIQFELGICNAAGESALAPGEGPEFIAAITPFDMKRIMDAFNTMNAVTDEAVEEERKN